MRLDTLWPLSLPVDVSIELSFTRCRSLGLISQSTRILWPSFGLVQSLGQSHRFASGSSPGPANPRQHFYSSSSLASAVSQMVLTLASDRSTASGTAETYFATVRESGSCGPLVLSRCRWAWPSGTGLERRSELESSRMKSPEHSVLLLVYSQSEWPLSALESFPSEA